MTPLTLTRCACAFVPGFDNVNLVAEPLKVALPPPEPLELDSVLIAMF